MAKQDDVNGARAAVKALERALGALTRHYSDSVDVRRLHADASRLTEDLDLLCGQAAPAAPPPPPPVLERIPDNSYVHDFWMDAEDEGLGSPGPRR